MQRTGKKRRTSLEQNYVYNYEVVYNFSKITTAFVTFLYYFGRPAKRSVAIIMIQWRFDRVVLIVYSNHIMGITFVLKLNTH